MPASDIETVIEPAVRWRLAPWRELHEYRDLFWLLVWRDYAARYKQTVLGPLWYVVQPLVTTVVFTFVFGHLARIPTDGAPPTLFYLAGLLGWNYFSQTFQSTSAALVNNAGLFGKVYFPRLVVPLSAVVSNLFMFAIQLAMYAVVWVVFGLSAPSATPRPEPLLLWMPLILAQIAALSLGTGLCLAALTTRYRDFSVVATFALQIWLYATPVIYPLSKVPAQWQGLVSLNPMTAPTELMRWVLLGTPAPGVSLVAISAALTGLLLLAGLALFQRVEQSFIDRI